MFAIEMKKKLLTGAPTLSKMLDWKDVACAKHFERPETARYISNAVLAKSKNRPSLPSPEEREYDLIKLDQ